MDRPLEVLLEPVERVVPRRPGIVGLEDRVGEAAGRMATCGCRHLAVVGSDGRLVGVLSEEHLRARLGSDLEAFPDAARKLLDETVESVMPRNALSVSRRAPLRDALAILLDGRVGALPVTNDDDRPIGMVSYVDLLAYLAVVARGWREGPGQRKPAR